MNLSAEAIQKVEKRVEIVKKKKQRFFGLGSSSGSLTNNNNNSSSKDQGEISSPKLSSPKRVAFGEEASISSPDSSISSPLPAIPGNVKDPKKLVPLLEERNRQLEALIQQLKVEIKSVIEMNQQWQDSYAYLEQYSYEYEASNKQVYYGILPIRIAINR